MAGLSFPLALKSASPPRTVFWFAKQPCWQVARTVGESVKQASASAVRNKPSRKGDRLIDFVISEVFFFIKRKPFRSPDWLIVPLQGLKEGKKLSGEAPSPRIQISVSTVLQKTSSAGQAQSPQARTVASSSKKTQLVFHRHTQRIAFRRRDVPQQSRSSALADAGPRPSPNSNRLCSDCQRFKGTVPMQEGTHVSSRHRERVFGSFAFIVKSKPIRSRKPAVITNSRWLAYATASAASALAGANSADAFIHYSGRIDQVFDGCNQDVATFSLSTRGNFFRLTDQVEFCNTEYGGGAYFGIFARYGASFAGRYNPECNRFNYLASVSRLHRGDLISNRPFVAAQSGNIALAYG